MKINFNDVTILEKENIMMREIIYSLQKQGGRVSRKDLRQDIRDNSSLVPAEYMDFLKRSENTGREYRPSDYQLNFAMKHLCKAGFLNSPTRGMWELTEKGRKVDVSHFDPVTQVRNLESEKPETQPQIVIEKIDEVEGDLSLQEDNWRNDLSNALKEMSPKRFEMFCRILVKNMGVEIDESKGVSYGNDGGIDGFGYIQSGDFRTARVAIQAKRWTGNVQSPEIDKFRGAMDKFNAEFGIFITTSDFSKGAIKASRIGTRVITLINGEDIADIVADKKLYVKEVVTYELEDFYFEEEN